MNPNSLLNGVLNSISSLGFRLRGAECENATYRLRGRLPFIQEFEFVPTSGTFRGRLDELELVFLPNSSTTADLHFQIDRKARGLSGFYPKQWKWMKRISRRQFQRVICQHYHKN